jgi:hypothetical protein
MTTDLLSIRDEIAQQDAKMDELLKSIMAPEKPRVRKPVPETPLGIVSRPRPKTTVPDVQKPAAKSKKKPSAEARRAALERKQF